MKRKSTYILQALNIAFMVRIITPFGNLQVLYSLWPHCFPGVQVTEGPSQNVSHILRPSCRWPLQVHGWLLTPGGGLHHRCLISLGGHFSDLLFVDRESSQVCCPCFNHRQSHFIILLTTVCYLLISLPMVIT